MIVGNHDTFFRNTNYPNSPELLVDDYDNITVYPAPSTASMSDGTKICMVPWINTENYADTMEEIKQTKAQICLGHLELAGFPMYKGSIAIGKTDPKIFHKFDLTCSGHFHHKSSMGDIHYLGNPYEITWSDYNDPRGFHILDTETHELEFVLNPYEIFHKVWYDDTDKSMEEVLDIDFSQYDGSYVKIIVSAKTNPYFFDMFLDNLYSSNAHNIQIVDDHHHIDELSEDDILHDVDDTLSVLKKTVEAMELDSGRDELNILLSDLYTEALAVEVA